MLQTLALALHVPVRSQSFCCPALLALNVSDLSLPGNVGVISSLKLLKVMRVFKMARHFKGSTVMAITLKTSFRGLWIFFCAFTVAVALLAMLIQVCLFCCRLSWCEVCLAETGCGGW